MERRIGSRITITVRPSGSTVQVRAPRPWPLLIGLSMMGVVIGALMVALVHRTLVGAEDAQPEMLLVLLPSAIPLLWLWCWYVFGREGVSVTQGLLTLARGVGPWQMSRRFPLERCTALRAVGYFGSPLSASDSLHQWGIAGGTVAFDFDGIAVRFGIGLEEAEAKAIVRELEPFVGVARRTGSGGTMGEG